MADSNPEDQFLVKVTDEYESKLNTKWRPLMGWLYMATCAFDFIIAPIAWSIIKAAMHEPITQWSPITLQGAGLYHLAMAAILGITSWTRGQEKMNLMSIMATASPNFNYPNPQQPNYPITPVANTAPPPAPPVATLSVSDRKRLAKQKKLMQNDDADTKPYVDPELRS